MDSAQKSSLQPSVCCVLVNWNGWQDTLECLASLEGQDYPNLSVVVVDNGSTNGSVERIREAHPWATVIETGRNLGYAAGSNVGTRAAYARGVDFVWLLNNDTVAPPDTASKLIRTALANPCAAAVGAVLYSMDAPEQVQAWGGGTVNLWTGYVRHFTAPAALGPNSYLTGACVLLPRHICEQVGLLYEGFFMYCDDSDLCLRLHRAGYSLVVAADTAILHKEGGSSEMLGPRQQNPRVDELSTTSMLRLLRRHAPVPLLSMAIYLLLRLGNRVVRGHWRNIAATLRGVRTYLREQNCEFAERLEPTHSSGL